MACSVTFNSSKNDFCIFTVSSVTSTRRIIPRNAESCKSDSKQCPFNDFIIRLRSFAFENVIIKHITLAPGFVDNNFGAESAN